MFAQIYEGCKCGETYKVTRNQIIDTERDDVWDELICNVCGWSVIKEKKIDGKLCLHPLSDDEIKLASGYYENEVPGYKNEIL